MIGVDTSRHLPQALCLWSYTRMFVGNRINGCQKVTQVVQSCETTGLGTCSIVNSVMVTIHDGRCILRIRVQIVSRFIMLVVELCPAPSYLICRLHISMFMAMRYLVALSAVICISLTSAHYIEARASSCSCDTKIVAVKAEIATIRSHSEADAAKIPLTPTASRTFFVT